MVRNQYAEAVKICRLGLLSEPTVVEGRMLLALSLTALGRCDEVLQELRIGLAQDPEHALGWQLRTEALVMKNDFAQARDALDRATALAPGDPKLIGLRAAIEKAEREGFAAQQAESTGTKRYPAAAVIAMQARADALDKERRLAVTVLEPPSLNELPPADMPSNELPTREIVNPKKVALDSDPSLIAQQDTDAQGVVIHTDHIREMPSPLGALGPGRLPVNAPTVLGTLDSAGMPVWSTDDPSEVASRESQQPTSLVPAQPKEGTTGEQRLTKQVQALERAPWNHLEQSRIEAGEAFVRPSVEDPAGLVVADPSLVEDLSLSELVEQNDDPSLDVGQPSDPSIDLSVAQVVFEPTSADEIRVGPESGAILRRLELEPPDHGHHDPVTPPRARPRALPQNFFVPLQLDPDDPSEQPGSVPLMTPSPDHDIGHDIGHDIQRGQRPMLGHLPSVEPVPQLAPPSGARRPRRTPGLLSKAVDALEVDPHSGRRNWLAIGAMLAVAVSVAVVAGLALREWHLRSRVDLRRQLAAQKLGSGNYAGFQAAELLYRQILVERDDRFAVTERAKVLARMCFEFGEPTEPAQLAVQALPVPGTVDDREAGIYLALAKGEHDLAARQATELLKDAPGPTARYLLGQALLLGDRSEEAATALRVAATEDPTNPVVLHALGLAESALRHPDRAFAAYERALSANANHVGTLIDRALLQLRQGQDRDLAAGAFEAITGKLANDAAPAQLAQAYVGLAEIELSKGNVAAARTALSSAAARRRDHPLLLEELAKAYADAFELEPAEREARRALAVSGRLTPRLILADVALRRSRPVQALTILEESGAKRPEALVLRALAKLELGRSAEARTDAEMALHLDLSLVAASVALARIDLADGKYDAASQRLETLEQKGKSAEVAWVLGQVYLARRMPDRARTCFRTALVRQPLLLQARLALARLLHDAGQLDEAREEVNRILATHAAYVPARRELAMLALESGDAVAARDEYDALADRDADVDNLLGGARARLLLGDARGADDRVERALHLHPTGDDLENATILKARALLLDRRPNEAIQLLLKSVRTTSHGEILALLLEAYLDYGRIDWAERATDLAPIAARTGVELTLAKARLALAQARQQAAKTLVEEALARLKNGRSPTWLRARALSLQGQAELELGNARGAVRSLRAALEIDPRNARTQHSLGFALIDLKQIDEAATAFQSAVRIDSRFAEAQYYLGWSWHSLSDARADDALRAYLSLEPKGALADDARRMLEGGDVTPTSDPPRTRHLER